VGGDGRSGDHGQRRGGVANGDDGNAFWRTTSSTHRRAKRAGTAYLPNKATGAAGLSAAPQDGQGAVRQPDRPQRQPAGLRRRHAVLLHGPTNWQTVDQLLYGSTIIATAWPRRAALVPAGNVWAGTMRPVMSRYVENASYVNSATAWWILFNPARCR
jgi:hypothetical protein